MTLFETRPITLSIARPAAEVYAFAHEPLSFPKWAAGLGAGITPDGDRWIGCWIESQPPADPLVGTVRGTRR